MQFVTSMAMWVEDLRCPAVRCHFLLQPSLAVKNTAAKPFFSRRLTTRRKNLRLYNIRLRSQNSASRLIYGGWDVYIRRCLKVHETLRVVWRRRDYRCVRAGGLSRVLSQSSSSSFLYYRLWNNDVKLSYSCGIYWRCWCVCVCITSFPVSCVIL